MMLTCNICLASTEHKVEWADGPTQSIVTTECTACSASGWTTLPAAVARERLAAHPTPSSALVVRTAIDAARRNARIYR